MRGVVLINDLDLLYTEQAGPGFGGVRRGCARKQEYRICAMHPTKPAQPADNLGYVCPEDPAILVGFIDDDISQASE